MPRNDKNDGSLRMILRRETTDMHSRLDGAMGSSDLTCPKNYAAFLQIQYAAREPIEAWADRHIEADIRPPSQCGLLQADLAALGMKVDETGFPFTAVRSDGASLGIAWALGGSSLGNRMMLSQIAGRVTANWPVAFLSDPKMQSYWKQLRPLLDQLFPCDVEQGAVTAARSVFTHFLTVHNSLTAQVEIAA